MKKAIDWFALLVGVLLAAFGARWMWTGWDIVQAERGWAAVIAGSVMLAGGLVVAMLAWVVMRLTSALARPATADVALPKPSPAPVAMPAAAAIGAAAGATAGLVMQRRETDDVIAAPEAPIDAPPPIQPPAPPSVGELLRMSEDRVVRETHDKHFEEPEIAPPPVEAAPSAEIDDVEDVLPPPPAPHVEAAAVPPPPPPMRAPEHPHDPLHVPEPPPAPAAQPEEPVYDDWLERTAREFDRELGRDAIPAPKEEPAPEPPPPPPKAEPAVVGRYSSGDTDYLMFADGSIEAQTPEGVMRFASLTELKRFVEKRN